VACMMRIRFGTAATVVTVISGSYREAPGLICVCIPLHAAGPGSDSRRVLPAGAPGHRDLDQAMSLSGLRGKLLKHSTLNAHSERQFAVQAVPAPRGNCTAKLFAAGRASFKELESTAHERSILVNECFRGYSCESG
jgi:hypothetical protein